MLPGKLVWREKEGMLLNQKSKEFGSNWQTEPAKSCRLQGRKVVMESYHEKAG